MRIFISLLLTIGAIYMAQSQMVTVKEKPSFYLGKRATFDLNLAVQPAFVPQKAAAEIDPNLDRNNTSGGIFIHFNPQANFTYALSNKVAVYLKGAANTRSRETEYYNLTEDQGNRYYVGVYEYGQPTMKDKAWGIGLAFFKTKQGFLAPIGTNWKIGVSKHHIKVNHDNTYYAYKSQNGVPIEKYNNLEYNIKNFSLDLEFAIQDLISENLYYSFGLSSSLNIGLRYGFNDDESGDVVSQLSRINKESLLYKDIAVLKLGLGYVIF